MQVAPVRIRLLDEPDLPRALPGLDLLLAPDGSLHRLPVLVPNQRLYAIGGGEAGRRPVLVVTHAGPEGAGDTDIDRAAIAVRHDVDGGVFLGGHARRVIPCARPAKLDPGLRRGDGQDFLRR